MNELMTPAHDSLSRVIDVVRSWKDTAAFHKDVERSLRCLETIQGTKGLRLQNRFDADYRGNSTDPEIWVERMEVEDGVPVPGGYWGRVDLPWGLEGMRYVLDTAAHWKSDKKFPLALSDFEALRDEKIKIHGKFLGGY